MKQQIIMHKKTASGYDEIYPDTSIDNILTNQTIADNVGVSDIDGQTVLESISATDKMISGYGTTSGTASAYTVNLVGKETMTPVDGMMIKVKFHVDSNEEPTINVNGSGANNIFTENGLKVLGTIKTGAWVLLMKSDALDGWVLQGWCKRNKMYTEIITSSQSWTSPDGVTMVTVRLFGGGGGGGGNGGTGGGGGGGGHMVSKVLTVTPRQVYPIIIGAGGNGGSAGYNRGTAGGNGGATSFGTLAFANGGSGGTAGRVSDNTDYAGDGGSGGTGGGGAGARSVTGTVSDGTGGSGSYGGSGGRGLSNSSAAGNGGNGIAAAGGTGAGGTGSGGGGAGGGYGGKGGDGGKPTFGGGGGGGGYGAYGNGGRGGNNTPSPYWGGDGGTAAGGGGGGCAGDNSGTGGNGGAGICIITYWKYE